ncbi:MAG: hypothetical protein HZA77_14430 [Candidatus Schekmanbacteria bacterium]|nr:hypothetical protein [Candidatus Schekmanbacteria bacterium]
MIKEKKNKTCKACSGKGYIEEIIESSSDVWVDGEPESLPLERTKCENCDGKGIIDEDS